MDNKILLMEVKTEPIKSIKNNKNQKLLTSVYKNNFNNYWFPILFSIFGFYFVSFFTK